MTNKTKPGLMALLASGLLAVTSAAQAYDSGSTGADGAFAPQVDTTLQLPEDGIFNFTTFTVPTGVTVDFEKNTTNTPVIILASGDVTIAGTLSVNGSNATDVGPKGDGNLGDDALPGIGGPGGYDGGAGGTPESREGGNGLGPGGAPGAVAMNNLFSGANLQGCGGAGAGYSRTGGWSYTAFVCDDVGVGSDYGTAKLQPLLGGSGGGGGYASTLYAGGGGGGGGGAILIASSGTVNVTGLLTANGGLGGDAAGANSGGTGGSGSGGAMRIIATTIAGNGTLTADGLGGAYHDAGGFGYYRSGNAADGRIRLEAENITRTTATLPPYSFSGPEPVFLANIPGVRITTVAGIAVPATPTGSGDVVVPEATPNPVAIEFATSNIPLGNTIELTITPQLGASSTAVSSAITGTDASGAASVSVDIPDGPSTLSAQVTFTVAVTALQQDYSQFAKGEKVEKVRIDFDPVKGSMTTFIAATGNEYTWPSNTVAIN